MVHINDVLTLNQSSVFLCDALEHPWWGCMHILFGKKLFLGIGMKPQNLICLTITTLPTLVV